MRDLTNQTEGLVNEAFTNPRRPSVTQGGRYTVGGGPREKLQKDSKRKGKVSESSGASDSPHVY